MKKMIKCLNNGKVYDSLTAIKDDLNINTSNINKVCTGKLKSVGGYRFEYVDTTNLPTKKLVDTNTNSDTKKLVDTNTNTNSDWQKIPEVISYRQKALAKMQEQKNRIEELEAELARLRATNTNVVIEPSQQEQDETGWDAYERELEERREKNPVMVEEPQPIIENKPKNPYLQDEEDDDWSDSFNDVSEEEVIKWQNEHQDQFTTEELKAIEQERERKKKEEEEKRRKQEEWDALTEEEKQRRKEEERQFYMDWFNNSLDRSKEQEQKRNEEFKAEMKKNKPVIIDDEPKQQEPQEEQEQQPKRIYKTINPDSLTEEEKEYRKRAGVPLDIDLSDADDGWEDFDIDDSLLVMR